MVIGHNGFGSCQTLSRCVQKVFGGVWQLLTASDNLWDTFGILLTASDSLRQPRTTFGQPMTTSGHPLDSFWILDSV